MTSYVRKRGQTIQRCKLQAPQPRINKFFIWKYNTHVAVVSVVVLRLSFADSSVPRISIPSNVHHPPPGGGTRLLYPTPRYPKASPAIERGIGARLSVRDEACCKG